MAEVKAVAEREIAAPAERVHAVLADYTTSRPKMLTAHYSEYEVRAGGTGEGTQVRWKLQATSKRVRDCLIEVTEPERGTLVERDANSTMVATWKVAQTGDARSIVSITTTWRGAGGIGGFFERTFAPGGLRKIYDEMLGKLDDLVAAAA
ncbi:MAG: SRPBCC family protein [Pseudonocardiaceae bacterium]|nr:SRPBCC family protein [Pseudonocardiaceae bacterium]